MKLKIFSGNQNNKTPLEIRPMDLPLEIHFNLDAKSLGY